ncbi:MAG: hypothetical protein IPK72_25680 [Candidatus Eisenbacteria bacterium]|nr:hypothetical protein [Candidatus Eisenbacteria bacterium]
MTNDRIDPSAHLDWETLFEQVEANHAVDSGAATHLAGCAACAAGLDRVRELHARLTAAALPQAPAEWISAARLALGLPPNSPEGPDAVVRAAAPRQWATGLREVWASLIAVPDTALAGVRGNPIDGSGARVHSAAGYVISIAESTKDGRRHLLGQVIPPSGSEVPANAVARALFDDRTEDAEIGEDGDFGWKGLPADCSEIDVLVGDLCLRIPLI